MKDFRRLEVWRLAHQLVLSVYAETRHLPVEERYGLQSQIRRSAASIPSNIAEGCGRGSDPDFARFLQMAIGSASEVEYQLLLCRDLGYLTSPTHSELSQRVVQVKKMLGGLVRTLRRS